MIKWLRRNRWEVTIVTICAICVILLSAVLVAKLTQTGGEGVVIEKRFEPAHTDYITRVVMIGKTPTTQIMPVFRSDAWTVVLRKEGTNGRVKERQYDVTQTFYEAAVIGEYVKITREDLD